MRPLQSRIRQFAREAQSQQMVIEKDYALSYVLAGIASQPALADTLVFKGGTALKKLYFGSYRFSEDLDFSTIDAPKDDELEEALRRAVNHSTELLNTYGPFTLQMERYLERDPHPGQHEPSPLDPYCGLFAA